MTFFDALMKAQSLAVAVPEYVRILSRIETEMVNLQMITSMAEAEIESKIGKYRRLSAQDYWQAVASLRNPKSEAMAYLNILEANFNYYRLHGRFAVDSQ